jgi:hypothetical protein
VQWGAWGAKKAFYTGLWHELMLKTLHEPVLKSWTLELLLMHRLVRVCSLTDVKTPDSSKFKPYFLLVVGLVGNKQGSQKILITTTFVEGTRSGCVASSTGAGHVVGYRIIGGIVVCCHGQQVVAGWDMHVSSVHVVVLLLRSSRLRRKKHWEITGPYELIV